MTELQNLSIIFLGKNTINEINSKKTSFFGSTIINYFICASQLNHFYLILMKQIAFGSKIDEYIYNIKVDGDNAYTGIKINSRYNIINLYI